MRHPNWGFIVLIALALASGPVQAADEAMASLESIVVVGTTPLAGSDIDRDRVPAATQSLDSRDINRTGMPGLSSTILSNITSATINDVEGNSFQPDILFRGFAASPVAGTPEGLAVFVNGARFNDAFGDTVNWDLIPPSAIKSVVIESSNPLFGLNALGGSVNVQLKDGFSGNANNFTTLGGSYGRASSILELSREVGAFAVYVNGDITHDDGFRRTSASDLYRGFADVGWRHDGAEIHLDLTAAHDKLGNPGATPVQALAADIASIFTAPNSVDNNYLAAHLHGTDQLSATASVQAMGYVGNFRQFVPNGITEDLAPCNNGSGLLCNADGTVVTSSGGRSVRDFLNGGVYSGLSVQDLQSHVFGASVQATDERPIGTQGTLANRLVAGASLDSSNSTFSGEQNIGGFDPNSRQFIGPGVVQSQASEGINPVRVRSTTRFLGLYFSETYPLSRVADLSLSGRFNDAQINLQDELGGPVNGQHTYSRFNPGAGLSYRFAGWGQFYGSYAETNRVPTPQELSCASAANPCSLLNFFVGDPNLEQIVAHTVEIGVRGGGVRSESADFIDGQIRWNIDAYHTRNSNDIIYESTVNNPNLAFYTNAGKTLRRGIEANLRYDGRSLHVRAGLAYTDASFRTPLDLNSVNNPAADGNGQIHVVPGNRIPGIPRRRATVAVDYAPIDDWTFGGEARVQSNAYRFGDEANRTSPLGGYLLVDLNGAYKPMDNVTVFAVLNNVFNKRYDTYGAFGPVGNVPWPNVPGGVTDPRTSSPGMPIAVYGGLRVTF